MSHTFEALCHDKSGKVTKPVVAWVSGTCAKLFKSEVQFGHAGAESGGASESAQVVASSWGDMHSRHSVMTLLHPVFCFFSQLRFCCRTRMRH